MERGSDFVFLQSLRGGSRRDWLDEMVKVAEFRSIHTYFYLEEAHAKHEKYLKEGHAFYLIARDRFNKKDKTVVKSYMLLRKEEIYDYVMSQESQIRAFHDVASEKFERFKLFLDVDYFKTEKLQSKQFYQKRVQDLMGVVKAHLGHDVKYVAQVCYYPQGVSFHVICVNVVYADVYKMKPDVESINAAIASAHKLPKDSKVFDERIYNKNRLFRMMHCRNLGFDAAIKGEHKGNQGFFQMLDQNIVEEKLEDTVMDKLLFNLCLIGSYFIPDSKFLK